MIDQRNRFFRYITQYLNTDFLWAGQPLTMPDNRWLRLKERLKAKAPKALKTRQSLISEHLRQTLCFMVNDG
jgi:hypothetical protein